MYKYVIEKNEKINFMTHKKKKTKDFILLIFLNILTVQFSNFRYLHNF